MRGFSDQAIFRIFSASVLVLGPHPQFSQIIESLYCIFDENKHSSNYLLEDMLLMSQTLKNILIARDSLIFLLQNVAPVINIKKSVLSPVKHIEFFGLHIHTEKRTPSFSQERLQNVLQQCQEIFCQPKPFILTLRKLEG